MNTENESLVLAAISQRRHTKMCQVISKIANVVLDNKDTYVKSTELLELQLIKLLVEASVNRSAWPSHPSRVDRGIFDVVVKLYVHKTLTEGTPIEKCVFAGVEHIREEFARADYKPTCDDVERNKLLRFVISDLAQGRVPLRMVVRYLRLNNTDLYSLLE